MSDQPIEDKIPLYPLLDAAERADVETYVEAHPEWKAVLKEARALDGLLEGARLLYRDPAGDEALAYYLAHHHVDPHEPKPALRRAFEHIEQQLEQHPDLRERQQRMQERLKELEAASDPVAQFERLTGRSLDEAEHLSEPAPVRKDRPSRQHARVHVLHSRWMHWSVAAGLAVVTLYVVLLLVSRATQPDLERLAVVEADDLQAYSTLRLRGTTDFASDTTTADQLFLHAVELLDAAYDSHLGLFPSYDDAQVDSAATLLEEVIELESPESFVRLEAYYFLGKARLAQNRPEEARAALQQVVDQRGPRIGEAEAIIAELKQRNGGN